MVTLFLAKVIGWYFIIASCFILRRSELIKSVLAELSREKALLVVAGMFTIVLGLIMIVAHNQWVLGWPLIITLFSWLVLIAGIIRTFYPEKAIEMGQHFINKPFMRQIVSLLFIILGFLLLYFAYAVYPAATL